MQKTPQHNKNIDCHLVIYALTDQPFTKLNKDNQNTNLNYFLFEHTLPNKKSSKIENSWYRYKCITRSTKYHINQPNCKAITRVLPLRAYYRPPGHICLGADGSECQVKPVLFIQPKITNHNLHQGVLNVCLVCTQTENITQEVTLAVMNRRLIL